MKVIERLARVAVALASGWCWIAFLFCWFGVAVLMSYDSNFRTLPEWAFNWEGSPAAMTFVSCITNGYYGYFPTANAYQEGGYEARASIFGPTVADALVCAAKRV